MSRSNLEKDPDFPANASAIDFGNNGVQVWNCGPSQGYGSPAGYCCDSGGQSTECCSTPSAVFHLDAATLGNPSSTTATTTATTSSTTASSSTGSSTTPLLISTPSPAVPTSTATISSMPTSSLSGLSNGAKAGIGVGVVLGVILSAGLVFGLWKMSRIAKSRKELHARPPATAATALPIIELDSVKPLRYELGEEGFYDRKGELVSELEASHGRSEMLS
ncbi:MAG: hypothetical protein M1820_002672 [Bogoriella megaspora]|nr:MAG: hypothetical protein M1820_002672 [Bogoriella megaspora]